MSKNKKNKNNKKKKQQKSKVININQINDEIQNKKVFPFPKTNDNLIDFSEQFKKMDTDSSLNVLSNKSVHKNDVEKTVSINTEKQTVETDNDDDDIIEDIDKNSEAEFLFDDNENDDAQDESNESSETNESDDVANDEQKETESKEPQNDKKNVSAGSYVNSTDSVDTNLDKSKKKKGLFNYIFTFFKDVPAAVVDKMKRIALFCLIFCSMCILMNIMFAFSWISVALALGMLLYSGIVIWSLKYKASSNMIVEFDGIVVNCKKIGFGKKFSYFIVLVVNENTGKMLSFKYAEDINGIERGVPITIYLDKNEPVVNSENGPFVEHYVSVMFGLNSSEELVENDSVSAEDFVK